MRVKDRGKKYERNELEKNKFLEPEVQLTAVLPLLLPPPPLLLYPLL